MGFVADEIGGVIRFKGNFDLEGMFRMMYRYLKNKNYDFYETKHKAKIPELEIKWECEKKVTPYYKYKIVIEAHFYDLTQTEIQDENGNTKKMTQGRFSMNFDGDIDKGYSTEWDEKKNHFSATLKSFYEALTKREFMAKHAQTLILEVAELRDRVNAHLGMVASDGE